MAYLKLSNHRLHYRIDGGAGDDKPWLVFCNSLGTDMHMWDAQVDALSAQYRILRYDCRGHGRSSAPPSPYSLDDLGGDVLALLDALGIEWTHFCGLSIGGLTGQWLGIHAGERLRKLVLCATAAKIGTAQSWSARIDAVQTGGLEALVPATAERWFTPKFRACEARAVAMVLDSFAATSPDGYVGCCAALARADLRDALAQIENPLLAISGEQDPVCPPADLDDIAARVRRGRHVSLPGRHIVNIESASSFNAVLLEFLGSEATTCQYEPGN
ncbi:3-oxoadipate enol-lactonase [Ensifer canadensis]